MIGLLQKSDIVRVTSGQLSAISVLLNLNYVVDRLYVMSFKCATRDPRKGEPPTCSPLSLSLL